jgi:hypothetical protein
MKAQLITSSIALMISFTSLAADVSWVKTPFWKAPQKTSFSVKLDTPTLAVQDNCKRYKKLIFAEDGSLNWPGQAGKIERYRTTLMSDAPMNVNNYEAILSINTNLENNTILEEEIDLGAVASESEDLLPNYTQSKSISGVYLPDITEFEVKILNEGSLTQVSRDLQLEDSKIVLMKGVNGNLSLKSFGRDVTCDLIEGKIELSARAPGYVVLPKEQMTKLNDFYHGKIEDSLNSILSNKEEALPIKAARIGYQLGQILDDEFNSSDVKTTEKRIKSLFDVVFVPQTLNTSKNLIEVNKRKTFRLDQNIEGVTSTVKFTF